MIIICKSFVLNPSKIQHLKYISCSYMTSMCCVEHMNWSGKIEFSQ